MATEMEDVFFVLIKEESLPKLCCFIESLKL